MDLDPKEYDLIREYVYEACGLIVDEQKKYLIQQRLGPLAEASGCSSFTDLHVKLNLPGSFDLHEKVIDAITTHETSFFRDNHPFMTFENHVCPHLLTIITKKQSLGISMGPKARIWCTASSTGQEPYSLAMLLSDFADNNSPTITSESFSILATDISHKSLDTAKAGTFSKHEISRGLATQKQERYFTQINNQWEIKKSIRSMVDFRHLNLTKPFNNNIGRFDVIVSRNILIYFDEETRREIFEQFFQVLNDGGFLMLGSTESIYGMTERFESCRFGETLIYRKKM
jgi:chemotaxis protein methyltransferase CheR